METLVSLILELASQYVAGGWDHEALGWRINLGNSPTRFMKFEVAEARRPGRTQALASGTTQSL